MKKRNKCIGVVEHVISWIKRFYGYETKPEKAPNTQKKKIKSSYNLDKPESDTEDATTEDELVAMSVLENDGSD